MPLDHVAVDQRGMTAFEVLRHAVLAIDQRQVVRRLHRHAIAMLPQVCGVLLATAALRVLIERLGRLLAGGYRERRCHHAENRTCAAGADQVYSPVTRSKESRVGTECDS